ncbi:MAG: queuosine precursor transporter [Deltaproteobacteria bacterium]|nr:MAG: queuosine precursor transporter [Deltaproteobacteria bacterium]
MNNQWRADSYLVLLACVYSGTLVLSAVLASKIISVGSLVVPAGVMGYSLTFVLTDVISEVWGKQRAKTVVMGGFVTLVLAFVITGISIFWPPAPFWPHQPEYETILGSSARIMIASLSAYLISQYHDVWAFHFWKRITTDRFLWLRNNASTVVSQLLDSVIFITLAFYGSMPVVPLILGQWVVKVGIAVLDTPFVYLLVHLIRRRVPSVELGSSLKS